MPGKWDFSFTDAHVQLLDNILNQYVQNTNRQLGFTNPMITELQTRFNRVRELINRVRRNTNVNTRRTY